MGTEQATEALAASKCMLGHSLAPLGLSEDDCLRITDSVRSVAAAWQIEIHEDAFGQLSLIIAPSKLNRIQLALIASRIDASYFLDEITAGNLEEVGQFQTIVALLDALRLRLIAVRRPCRSFAAPADADNAAPDEVARVTPRVGGPLAP